MPIRIQRKRTKGWKMPKNTVSVTRPGKWGNPFFVSGQQGHWFVLDSDDNMQPFVSFHERKDAIECAIELYKESISHKHNSGEVNIILELKGKNLACWCKEGEPCHADVLLKLANTEPHA